jgi:hypothetical protein
VPVAIRVSRSDRLDDGEEPDVIRTYDDAVWAANTTSTLRLRWYERRARRLCGEGRLDRDGHVRWAASMAVLRRRHAAKR